MNLWRIHETTTNSPNANLLIVGQTAPFPAEWLRDSPMCIYTYLHTCRYVGNIVPQANDHLVKMHTAVQNEGRRRCALLCKTKAEEDAHCCARRRQKKMRTAVQDGDSSGCKGARLFHQVPGFL